MPGCSLGRPVWYCGIFGFASVVLFIVGCVFAGDSKWTGMGISYGCTLVTIILSIVFWKMSRTPKGKPGESGLLTPLMEANAPGNEDQNGIVDRIAAGEEELTRGRAHAVAGDRLEHDVERAHAVPVPGRHPEGGRPAEHHVPARVPRAQADPKDGYSYKSPYSQTTESLPKTDWIKLAGENFAVQNPSGKLTESRRLGQTQLPETPQASSMILLPTVALLGAFFSFFLRRYLRQRKEAPVLPVWGVTENQ